jgi:hypothetical protein
MQWLFGWYREFQRYWFIVKRWLLRVLPLFGHDPSKHKAVVAKKARGRVLPERSYLDHFVRSEAASSHPVVDELKRRATNELFDWLGLSMIPPQTWVILDKVGDPGSTLEQLIRALGCDPLRARRREPEEIARLDAAIDVLIALDSLRPYLSVEHLREIEYLLFGGDYDAVKAYSRIVTVLSAVLIGCEKAKSLRLFAAYESFVEVVEGYLADPWDLAPEDAEDALELSDRFINGMERYTSLNAEISATISAIHSVWSGSTGAPDPDLLDGILLHFEEIDGRLADDAEIGLDEIDDLMRQVEEVLEDLRLLLEDLQPDAGPDGGSSAAGLDEIGQALVFFGFAAGSSPSPEEIKQAFKRKMKEVHPDLAPKSAGAAEKARREEMAKETNQHYDLLRRCYTKAA